LQQLVNISSLQIKPTKTIP